jgi:hypothetical protein
MSAHHIAFAIQQISKHESRVHTQNCFTFCGHAGFSQGIVFITKKESLEIKYFQKKIKDWEKLYSPVTTSVSALFLAFVCSR